MIDPATPKALRAIASMMRMEGYRTDACGVEALVLDNAADDIERLLEENKKLRETVKYYAIESNWEYWLKNQSIANIRAWQTLEELK